MMPFRCHALSNIMAEPKKKGEVLSEGAKSYVLKLAKQIIFDVQFQIDNKFVNKGLMMEQSAIDMLNLVRGTSYVKNNVRRVSDWLTGEPDIVDANLGVDIKCPWSMDTFPLTAEEGHKSEYEWQARGYMWLFNKPRWQIAYCLVDTPPELCKWEPAVMHRVWQIPPAHRVTIVQYERDRDAEAKMREKVEAAQSLLTQIVNDRRAQDELLADMNPTLKSAQAVEPDWSRFANTAAKAAFSS